MDMEQEIRDKSGGDLQDKIEDVPGTKTWGETHPEKINTGGGSSGSASEGGEQPQQEQPQQEFPRASKEEVFEAAERAKAQFGGTAGGGGGVESDADTSVAQGAPPSGDPGDYQEASGGGQTATDTDADSVEEAPAGDGDALTTGQKLAGIMGSDPSMKWESKIADKLSGGDDDKATG